MFIALGEFLFFLGGAFIIIILIDRDCVREKITKETATWNVMIKRKRGMRKDLRGGQEEVLSIQMFGGYKRE